ncbi:MAG: hypothetical protein J6X60_08080, partial [Ruminiclostridium sp.]|nr:hypothetical protein [Ruminiclostridium sp.]
MSTKEKNEIISQIFMLLSKLVESDVTNGESEITGLPVSSPTAAPVALPAEQRSAVPDEPMEMLTIKECTELVKGLTSNTIRKLIARGEIECVRAGCGTNG